MKKICVMIGGAAFLASALAMPVFAQTTTSTAASKPKVDLACMQSAITVRETAISSDFSVYSSAVSSALSARASALNSAWSKTTAKERSMAIKAAWKTYRTAVSSARSAWSKTRQADWITFYSARKSCGRGAAAEDATTHSVDAAL